MKPILYLIQIIWGGVSFRIGVFTTEKKAKQFMFESMTGMKVWVESIDDGMDHHFIRDDLIAHIDFNQPLLVIGDKVSSLLSQDSKHDYHVIITVMEPNVAIQIN
jgi:hypothetical protein